MNDEPKELVVLKAIEAELKKHGAPCNLVSHNNGYAFQQVQHHMRWDLRKTTLTCAGCLTTDIYGSNHGGPININLVQPGSLALFVQTVKYCRKSARVNPCSKCPARGKK